MTGPDPLQTVWDALEAGGYGPHGPLHNFRSRCPAHQGPNRDGLHVFQGVDRVVPWCFRGCTSLQVVEAVGLKWRDLFRAGHRQNRQRAKPRPKPRGAMELALDGLQLLGIGVHGMWVADRCPYCDGPGLWLRMEQGRVSCECVDGCDRDDVLSALETRMAIEEAKAKEARNGNS